METDIRILVEEDDALNLLLELNEISGVEAAFAESDIRSYQEDKEHSEYFTDFATLSELIVQSAQVAAPVVALATTLINYRIAKVNLAKENKTPGPPPAPTIVINGESIMVTESHDANSLSILLETKLRQTSSHDSS